MKRIALFILVGLLLFATGCISKETESPPETSQSETETEPTTEETITTAEETTVAEKEEKVFSYSEIDSKFGPGPFSVNELATIFGEPLELQGVRYDANGNFALIAKYNGVSFDLVAFFHSEELKELSFYEDADDYAMYEFSVSQEDREVQIEPYLTKLSSDKIDFIRGIKIGDSKEKVIAAYDGYAGEDWEYEGVTNVFYDYRPDKIIEYTNDERFNIASQTGNVIYSFKEGKLIEISITWYDGYLAFD